MAAAETPKLDEALEFLGLGPLALVDFDEEDPLRARYNDEDQANDRRLHALSKASLIDDAPSLGWPKSEREACEVFGLDWLSLIIDRDLKECRELLGVESDDDDDDEKLVDDKQEPHLLMVRGAYIEDDGYDEEFERLHDLDWANTTAFMHTTSDSSPLYSRQRRRKRQRKLLSHVSAGKLDDAKGAASEPAEEEIVSNLRQKQCMGYNWPPCPWRIKE